jgi:hypothetical protein
LSSCALQRFIAHEPLHRLARSALPRERVRSLGLLGSKSFTRKEGSITIRDSPRRQAETGIQIPFSEAKVLTFQQPRRLGASGPQNSGIGLNEATSEPIRH